MKLVNYIEEEYLYKEEDFYTEYEVWALGYNNDEEITDTEILLGTFENPDDAVQYISIITQHELLEEAEKQNISIKDIYYFSLETETVVSDGEGGTMNAGTIHRRNIYVTSGEDITLNKEDYEILDSGELKVSCKLLKDFNKNDTVKILFKDEAGQSLLAFKIISRVLYEDGNYYHLEFIY